MTDRSEWKSRTGFLLAALGSAIGLGNIWRFPYVAWRNGGGAFLIPYFVALFVVGVPLLMLEFGLGHYSKRAFPAALAKIHPRFRWIGWWSVSFVMFGIVAYYGVVIAWCGNYVVYSVTQPWGDVSGVNRFFDEQLLGAFVNGMPFEFYSESEGLRLGRLNIAVTISLSFVWGINWLITRRHLQDGVEFVSRLFIPALIALTAILVAWSWNFAGADAGRAIYLKPDWSRVFEARTWIDAFTQIFFSLSIGFGIMVAYASYLPKKTDIPTNAFLASIGNCAFSVFAGFAVFAAIGLLAHSEDINLTEIADVRSEIAALEEDLNGNSELSTAKAERLESLRETAAANDRFERQMSSLGLVFKTYPAIITKMGGMTGPVFGVLFFISLIVAGISSSISIIEAFLCALSDEFGWSRSKVSAVLCSIGFCLGLVFCTQAGLFWLDLVDHFITTYALVLVAICESLIVGWFFTTRRLRTHFDEYRDFRFGRVVNIAMRLVITTLLMLTWLGLSRLTDSAVAASIGRFLVVACGVLLWIDEHWLDFDVRIVIPALLVFLLDQALLKELASPYGGYHLNAVLSIGVGWLGGTLALGLGLSVISAVRESSSNAPSR